MFTAINDHFASGVFGAVWTMVWHWGLGVGVIILLLLAAYLSPVSKIYFLVAAAIVAALLFAYSNGLLNERKVCEAKIKYIYLRAHPQLQTKNLAPRWTVSPDWYIGKPYTPSHVCGGLEWGCQP
jgi:hypothetical protein